MGVVASGFYFFILAAMDNAAEQISRRISTGEVRVEDAVSSDFKESICRLLPEFGDCSGNLRVIVFPIAHTLQAGRADCVTSAGHLASDTYTDAAAAVSESAWIITLCYRLRLLPHTPLLPLERLSDGSSVVRASAVFALEGF